MTTSESTSAHRIEAAPNAATLRVRGLDALRFICALWVVFWHLGTPPLLDSVDRSSIAGRIVHSLYANLVCGPAAVVVFFVISGFCIHFPFRRQDQVDLVSFFARRHIRILTPVLVALATMPSLGLQFSTLDATILWSLVCEEIYYTVYPVLLRVRRRTGWLPLIGVGYVLGLCVVLTKPQAVSYHEYGYALTWLLGLPCWLLGCALAEGYDAFAREDARGSALRVWSFRLGILGLSMLANFLRFHSPLTYVWTLNGFAAVVFFWLREEILFARERPTRRLESWGAMSYSMYLIHLHADELWKRLFAPTMPALAAWLLQYAFILACCFAFYLAVERPSHRLARTIHLRVTEWTARRRLALTLPDA